MAGGGHSVRRAGGGQSVLEDGCAPVDKDPRGAPWNMCQDEQPLRTAADSNAVKVRRWEKLGG